MIFYKKRRSVFVVAFSGIRSCNIKVCNIRCI